MPLMMVILMVIGDNDNDDDDDDDDDLAGDAAGVGERQGFEGEKVGTTVGEGS